MARDPPGVGTRGAAGPDQAPAAGKETGAFESAFEPEEDPLGGLHVSADGILARDLYVVDQLRRRGIPTLMLPSGGYTQTGYRLLADSAVALVRRYGEGAK